MRSVMLVCAATTLFVAAMVVVAVLWCHWSHVRRFGGPVLFRLWSNHGVHLSDVAVLVFELILFTILTSTIIAGFSRGH